MVAAKFMGAVKGLEEWEVGGAGGVDEQRGGARSRDKAGRGCGQGENVGWMRWWA